jgi:hypothetical protein
MTLVAHKAAIAAAAAIKDNFIGIPLFGVTRCKEPTPGIILYSTAMTAVRSANSRLSEAA